MDLLKRIGFTGQRGNAVLFSLIIMAAAMVISLGMVTLVANEARTVGLVVPGEKAYYKAESFVEQALWEKKNNQNYQVEDRDDLPADYLCSNPVKPPPCFEGEAGSPTNAVLKEFQATTSPIDDEIGLQPDVAKQFDILTDSATGSGSIDLTNIVGESGFRGLEVTIIAYAANSGNLESQFPVIEDDPTTPGTIEGAGTPVFIDKVFVQPGNNGAGIPDQRIDINQARQNSLQENYLPFDGDHIYRVRLKALGAPATLEMTAESTNGELPVVSPDFAVRSVAQDGSARRGLQVLLPASEQTASIFDFVLFSDLDLDKIRSKVPGTTNKAITVRMVRDTDQDCNLDPGESTIPGVTITANPGYETTTNADGVAPFNNLHASTSYTLTAEAPAGTEFCPPGSSTTVTTSAGTAPQNIIQNFLVRTPLPPRVPIYQHFYNYGFHGGLLDYDFYYTTASFVQNYSSHGIAFYTYQVPTIGTSSLYWTQPIGGFGARYYQVGPTASNIVGWIPTDYFNCPNGSSILYSLRYRNGTLGNLLTLNPNPYLGYMYVSGYLGCAWSSE